MATTPTPVRNRATGKAVPQAGDMTALRSQQLEDDRDAERAEAARRATQQAEVEDYEARNVVIDYTGADTPLPVAVEATDNQDPYREIIIKYGIDQMAFGREIIQNAEYDGHGNITIPPRLGGIRYFTFKEGRKYRVPRALADHLDERGYVFH
jgi:hypothetical protein